MDDMKLRELGRRAEDAVDLPDLASLERRGHALRSRRQAGIVAAVALVAVSGTWLVQGRTPQEVQPAPPVEPTPDVRPYPGPQMKDLEPGTYELFPSRVPSEPTALVTVPEGWNSWQGPNRFDGHRPDEVTNDDAYDRSTWYAGLLVAKITAVADSACAVPTGPDEFVATPRTTVEALASLPGHRLVGEPDTEQRFGYRSTHLELRRSSARQCPDINPLTTSANGLVGIEGRTDFWVVDVAGTPLTIMAGTDGDVPPRVTAELDAMVESLEFVQRD